MFGWAATSALICTQNNKYSGDRVQRRNEGTGRRPRLDGRTALLSDDSDQLVYHW